MRPVPAPATTDELGWVDNSAPIRSTLRGRPTTSTVTWKQRPSSQLVPREWDTLFQVWVEHLQIKEDVRCLKKVMARRIRVSAWTRVKNWNTQSDCENRESSVLESPRKDIGVSARCPDQLADVVIRLRDHPNDLSKSRFLLFCKSMQMHEASELAKDIDPPSPHVAIAAGDAF
jgi:hypothetical protein